MVSTLLSASRCAIPARAGVGLKAEHYRLIVGTLPDIGFFEVRAENYMSAGDPRIAISRRCANIIRCRCMGSAFRSALIGRWTAITCDG